MRKNRIVQTCTALAALCAASAANAQSGAYYSSVTNLNPVIYLPLNETVQPPGSLVAINSGTLGAADDGAYRQGAYPGAPGAIAGSSDTAAYVAVDAATISAPYDTAYTGDTNFTVEFWINSANQDPGTDCILNCVDAASPRHGWLFYTDINSPAGTFNFRTYGGNGLATSLNYDLPVPGGHILANTWYHVVVTHAYDGTNETAQGYVNGQPVAPATAGPVTNSSGVFPAFVPSTAGPLTIGGRSDNSFYFYPGSFDEVALYPTVLSAAEISNHYAAAVGGVAGAYTALVNADQPQLYFKLDDGVLPVATNYGTAGAMANASYQPGTAPGTSGPAYSGFGASSYAVQFPGGAATYNGATVLDPGAALLPIGQTANSPVTVSAWVLVPSVPTSFSTVLGKGDSSYRFDVDTSGDPHWNPGAFGDVTDPNALADSAWHYWVGTWDGSNVVSFYIDGANVIQSSGNTGNTFNTNVLDLGAAPDYTGRNFEGGSLCQVALFTNALSQSQIINLYFASGVTGVAPIITSQPESVNATNGETVTFSVAALGYGTLSYQWYGPNNVALGTGPTLTVSGVTTNSDGGYFVVVTDSEAPPQQSTSAAATLAVIPSLPGTYFAAVSALGPVAYWPLNETMEPGTNYNASETNDPVATNYGSAGFSANGYYLPGTYPGTVPGPSFPGLPTTTATAFNSTNFVAGGNYGLAGFVDVPDPNNLLDDTGPLSIAVWLQAAPSDGRFETVLGRGDSSYRISVDGASSDALHFAQVGEIVGVPPAGDANDGNWHLVVGTFDGAKEVLYVDGVANSSSAESGTAAGVNFSDLTIGEAPDYTNRAFDGNIAEVAVFNYGLSAAQVQSLYYAAGIAPYVVTEPPATVVVLLGATTNISAAVRGSPALSYFWSTNGGATPLSGSEFSGTTTSTLTITSASATDSGAYVLVISNTYGVVTSTPTVFTATDKPVLTVPLPNPAYAYVGTTLTLPVGEVGPAPFTNVWYANGVKLTDGAFSSGAVISGSATATLTISNIQVESAGTYTFYASTTFGVSSEAGSVVVDTEPQFRDSGVGTPRSVASSFGSVYFTPTVSNGVLQLTTAGEIEATAYWFNQKYYVGGFQVHYVFEDISNNVGGVCFVFQNDALGVNACGDCGEALGVNYWGSLIQITNSFEFEIDCGNDGGTKGAAIQTNGLAAPYTAAANALSGPSDDTNESSEFGLADLGTARQPQDIWITYYGTNMTIAYSNEVSGATATYETNVGPDFVQSAVGNKTTAYMGFTAGTSIFLENGGYYYYPVGDQFTVSDFSYTPIVTLSITKTNGTTEITWPAGVGGAELQSTTNLAATVWNIVPTPSITTNSSGMNLFTVPGGSPSTFYRLQF